MCKARPVPRRDHCGSEPRLPHLVQTLRAPRTICTACWVRCRSERVVGETFLGLASAECLHGGDRFEPFGERLQPRVGFEETLAHFVATDAPGDCFGRDAIRER